jgi:hypothetical protein
MRTNFMKDQESITGSWSEKPKVGVDNHTFTKKQIHNDNIKIQTPKEVGIYNTTNTSWVYDYWEELEAEVQEVIIDLIVSIIENKKTKK